MVWVKLDDQFFRNPKARAAGRDGRALYLAGLCYSASALTDGFIADNAIKPVCADAEVRQTAIKALTDTGLWRQVPGGYEIHDYREYQRASADVRKQRDEGKERAARSRERKANEARAFADRSADLAPSPCLSGVTSVKALTSVTRDLEGRGLTERQQHLAARMVAACTGTGPYVLDEAVKVVLHVTAHIDWVLVDEAIGWSLNADSPPSLPRYFVRACQRKAGDHGLRIPDLIFPKRRAS